MSTERLLVALESAFTGYEKNDRAQLFELLSEQSSRPIEKTGPLASPAQL